MKFPCPLLAVAGVLSLAAPSQAAVTYTDGTYNQTFDSLSGVSVWANDSTLAGWYAATTATASITAIGSNTGTTTAAGLYSFGVNATNPLAERAFGFAPSNSFTGASGVGQGFLGLNLTNSNSWALDSFTLTYDGEQWRKENNAAVHTIVVQYSLDATSLTTGTWTNLGGTSTFSSPIAAATTATALDGNASANRAAGLTGTASSINWAAGSSLWIRFVDLNDTGNDHLLAIDNVNFTAVPEPAAALLGTIGLMSLLRRRR